MAEGPSVVVAVPAETLYGGCARARRRAAAMASPSGMWAFSRTRSSVRARTTECFRGGATWTAVKPMPPSEPPSEPPVRERFCHLPPTHAGGQPAGSCRGSRRNAVQRPGGWALITPRGPKLRDIATGGDEARASQPPAHRIPLNAMPLRDHCIRLDGNDYSVHPGVIGR
jgi:hypothetical protein